MNTILCPTRGGEGSIPNQIRAIALAKEQKAQLVFLYVSNIHFLDHAAGPVMEIDLVEEHLEEVGEFLLAMAQERAKKEGVEAEAVVMRGEFGNALEEIIEEKQVSTIVIGSAYEDTGFTTREYRRKLAAFLTEKYKVDILVTDQGEIMEHHRPAEPEESES